MTRSYDPEYPGRIALIAFIFCMVSLHKSKAFVPLLRCIYVTTDLRDVLQPISYRSKKESERNKHLVIHETQKQTI